MNATSDSPRYSLGPCADCNAYGPEVILIRAVACGSGPDRHLFACPDHAPTYISRTQDIAWLARRRAAETGESTNQARQALERTARREPRPPK
ncbi:hypothetical protein [Streptomyces sp. ODS28]|uniref:hypothetical protein n=1 Tax=Streptomyces sp. ODS28 TaxID=3136688 RepID=UPI0031EEC2A8